MNLNIQVKTKTKLRDPKARRKFAQLMTSGVKMLGLEIMADPADAFAAADDSLGKGVKRVIVFPSGGVSYPVLR